MVRVTKKKNDRTRDVFLYAAFLRRRAHSLFVIFYNVFATVFIHKMKIVGTPSGNIFKSRGTENAATMILRHIPIAHEPRT